MERLLSRRARVFQCNTLYGAGLGVASLLVSLLAQTRFPKVPAHMEFVQTLAISTAGAIAGAILGFVMTYWGAQRAEGMGNALVWAFLGFLFGVLLSPLTGAFLPASMALMNAAVGVIGPGELPLQIAGSVLRAPGFMFTHGVFGLFTGMLAGAFFFAGGWLLDRVNERVYGTRFAFGVYVLAVAFAAAVVLVAAYGPPATLAKLG